MGHCVGAVQELCLSVECIRHSGAQTTARDAGHGCGSRPARQWRRLGGGKEENFLELKSFRSILTRRDSCIAGRHQVTYLPLVKGLTGRLRSVSSVCDKVHEGVSVLKKLFAMGAFGALAACGTVTQMTPTGGSRADGIVELSYEYGPFNKVKLDPVAAQAQAKARCQTWGYQDAEAFGGVIRQCQMPGGLGGCSRWFATMKFQCTGAATPS